MKIGKEFLKVVNKKYEPLAVIDTVMGKYDITLKSNSEGDPVLLFIGKRNSKGTITGERFSRTLKYNEAGQVIKDHWEKKGKST